LVLRYASADLETTILFWFLILCAELDILEADMDFKSNSLPSYLQGDKESILDSELNLPAVPSSQSHSSPKTEEGSENVPISIWLLCCYP
jgi:hypothetical protein